MLMEIYRRRPNGRYEKSVGVAVYMNRSRRSVGVRSVGVRSCALLAALALAGPAACESGPRTPSLPTALSDDAFWALSTGLSEPAGEFTHSENLVSNEMQFAHTVRLLRRTGGVYIGVGPEQNFSYIAKLQPAMAFIIDIRRENRNLQLMYKALFEITSNREEFVFRLFSRERPSGLAARASVQALFRALAAARRSSQVRDETAGLIRQRLVDERQLPLTADDVEWIEYALDVFHSEGPDIDYYGGLRPTAPVASPSYRVLMTATDMYGQSRSYLATEESFAAVKDLQSRNLVVPLIGDFGGPGALRRIGDYVRQGGGMVSAFYGSNVEVYLTKQRTAAFCASLASLPRDSRTSFIESKGVQTLQSKLARCPRAH
jgi:hypothetical protein